LVEAAVVAPVLVLFYGILVFVYREYEVKQGLILQSRHTAFKSALTQCQGLSPGEEHGLQDRGLNEAPGFAAWSAQRYVPLVADYARMAPFLLDRDVDATVTLTGVATNEVLSNMVRSRTLKSMSQVYCAPKDILQTGATGIGESPQVLSRRTAYTLTNALMGELVRFVRVFFTVRDRT